MISLCNTPNYRKYTKYSTFAFSLGHITVKVNKNRDINDLKLPDPFTFKIVDNNDNSLKIKSALTQDLPFDFMSLINILPYKRDTLEQVLMDNYKGNNCINKSKLFENNFDLVTYIIILDGTEGDYYYINEDINHKQYNKSRIHDIKAIKKAGLVVKNIKYNGVWISYKGFT